MYSYIQSWAARTEKCCGCGEEIQVKAPKGPIPVGFPNITDHGYLMCSKCIEDGKCPACMSSKK